MEELSNSTNKIIENLNDSIASELEKSIGDINEKLNTLEVSQESALNKNMENIKEEIATIHNNHNQYVNSAEETLNEKLGEVTETLSEKCASLLGDLEQIKLSTENSVINLNELIENRISENANSMDVKIQELNLELSSMKDMISESENIMEGKTNDIIESFNKKMGSNSALYDEKLASFDSNITLMKENLETESKQLDTKITEVQKSLDYFKDSSENIITNTVNEVDEKLRDITVQMKENNLDLDSSLENLQKDITRLQDQYDNSNNIVGSLKESITINEASNNQNIALLQASVLGVKETNEQLSEIMEKLKDDNSAFEELYNNNLAVFKKEFEHNISSHSEQLETMNARISSIDETTSAFLAALKDDISSNTVELESALQSVKNKVDGIEETITLIKTGDIKELEDTINKNRSDLISAIGQSREEFDRSMEELKENQSKNIDNISGKLMSIDNIESSMNEIHSFIEDSKKLNSLIDERTDTFEATTSDIKALENKFKNIEKIITEIDHSEQLEMLSASVDGNREEIESLKNNTSHTTESPTVSNGLNPEDVLGKLEILEKQVETISLENVHVKSDTKNDDINRLNETILNLLPEVEKISDIELKVNNLGNACNTAFAKIETTLRDSWNNTLENFQTMETNLNKNTVDIESLKAGNIEPSTLNNSTNFSGYSAEDINEIKNQTNILREYVEEMEEKLGEQLTEFIKCNTDDGYIEQINSIEKKLQQIPENITELYSTQSELISKINILSQNIPKGEIPHVDMSNLDVGSSVIVERLQVLETAYENVKNVLGGFQGNVEEMIEEMVTVQRKQLVSAMRTHVSSVEQMLREEMKNLSESLVEQMHILEENTKAIAATTPRGEDLSSEQILALKSQVEALFGTCATLGVKLANIEAELDL
eukprot:TRINITY_DN8454_c0_g1_i1.p1 TRINITY_DN8454_c0_g1~~TRINITY_DN8454_c0_g1_i1.p1  ORF type:complete len:898 (+),score=248.96 TRINITY_DN8454_c0_g1_i1:1794-4487(+)